MVTLVCETRPTTTPINHNQNVYSLGIVYSVMVTVEILTSIQVGPLLSEKSHNVIQFLSSSSPSTTLRLLYGAQNIQYHSVAYEFTLSDFST